MFFIFLIKPSKMIFSNQLFVYDIKGILYIANPFSQKSLETQRTYRLDSNN